MVKLSFRSSPSLSSVSLIYLLVQSLKPSWISDLSCALYTNTWDVLQQEGKYLDLYLRTFLIVSPLLEK